MAHADLIAGLDAFVDEEPPNVSHIAEALDAHNADAFVEAMRSLDSATARHLRRALQDWQQATRRLRSAAVAYDRAEARVRQGSADLAAELRKG